MRFLVLHGGASLREELKPKVEKFAELAFEKETAVDAVVEAVRLMEDDPDFNAGTGSNIRIDGSIQMDAAVMTPHELGAVINIERVKNPVLVARDVMQKSPHIILSGDGAVKFARKMGYPDYDPRTKYREDKRKSIIEKLKNGQIPEYYHPEFFKEFLGDTVGAVAFIDGKFAAAVSTGGTALTLRGRVGDSPIPGAGIYCGEKGAAVATGIGEEIIKRMASLKAYNMIGDYPLHSICSRIVKEFGEVPFGIIMVSREETCGLSNLKMPYAIISE